MAWLEPAHPLIPGPMDWEPATRCLSHARPFLPWREEPEGTRATRGERGALTLQGSPSAEQSGRTCSCPRVATRSTYHDNGDPGGRAVLFGERVIKVLFEFTCYFSLHIILLGGVILQKRIKDTDFESRVHAVSSSAVTHHPSLPPSPPTGLSEL